MKHPRLLSWFWLVASAAAAWLILSLRSDEVDPSTERNIWGWLGAVFCIPAFLWYRQHPRGTRSQREPSTFIDMELPTFWRVLAIASFPVPIAIIAAFQKPKLYISAANRSDPRVFALGLHSFYLSLYLVLAMGFLWSAHGQVVRDAWRAHQREPRPSLRAEILRFGAVMFLLGLVCFFLVWSFLSTLWR